MIHLPIFPSKSGWIRNSEVSFFVNLISSRSLLPAMHFDCRALLNVWIF